MRFETDSGKIVIEGKDVDVLQFGMAGGPAVGMPNRRIVNGILNELAELESSSSARVSGDFWVETVEIDASDHKPVKGVYKVSVMKVDRRKEGRVRASAIGKLETTISDTDW